MHDPYPVADFTAFSIQEIGALLFGMAFLFLYRQSQAVYFGLWAIAWPLRFLAAIFGFELLRTLQAAWLAPYATFEFAFAIVLISAARAGFASDMKDWRTVLRLIAILPIFVALVWAIGTQASIEAYQTSHALVLAVVYYYNFAAVAAAARHRRPVLPLFAAHAFRAVPGARRGVHLSLQPRIARRCGRTTCTTKATGISCCIACWRFPPWRCGAKARWTAFETWAPNWTTCAASAGRARSWTT